MLVVLVIKEAERYFAQTLDAAGIPEEKRGISLQPKNLAATCNWFIDASTIFASVLGPLVGWLLLKTNLNPSLFNLLYAATLFSGILGFAAFLIWVKPAGYADRPLGVPLNKPLVGIPPIGPLTPVTVLVTGINVAAALTIVFTGVNP